MNRLEHLLFIVSEEAAEVAQRASKCARFGVEDKEPGQNLTNEQRIWGEVNDLMGALELLGEQLGNFGLSREAINAKKAKVEQFLLYSKNLGTLTDD